MGTTALTGITVFTRGADACTHLSHMTGHAQHAQQHPSHPAAAWQHFHQQAVYAATHLLHAVVAVARMFTPDIAAMNPIP